MLFGLKSTPCEAGEVKEILRIPDNKQAVFDSFLTPERPSQYAPYVGQGVRWRYFGHAFILIESQGISMLFDPVLCYTYESSVSRYTYLDLPDVIDYVLITHNRRGNPPFGQKSHPR
jgi:hypothetical protein